ncbi:phosphatase PAP2 family protein [Nonomuraea dietziae]|uniref:phosphatase PAP2 family protein n=1 Tax=Nonomuraea dietziae TaxID=65515 RepID=UPI0033F0E3E6
MTEVFSPVNIVLALPPVIGVLSAGWTGAAWGAAVSAVCGGVPAVTIARGVRRGGLDSRHIVDRKSRFVPMLFALAAVVVMLAALLVWDGPRAVTASVVVMLAWLATLGPITAVWKISFHTAVSAGAVVMLAYLLPAVVTLVVGVLLVAVIGWARVRVTHHTLAQVLVGAPVGAAVAWAVFALMV